MWYNSRMKKILILTMGAGLLVLAFYFYFHNVGRVQASVNEIFISSEQVPESFDGARIVQISDVLIRDQSSLVLLENLVASVNELNPEIIVFTGNLFLNDGLAFEMRVTELLSELEASLIKLAVFGYHDLEHQDVVEEVLGAADFHILNNDAFQVFNLSAVGLNFIGAAPLNDRETLVNLLDAHVLPNRTNILLASLPTFSAIALDYPILMKFSGHCLGIQDTTHIGSPCFQFYDGIYQFADQMRLHVSPGLARFHNTSGLFRRPRVDSFLLIHQSPQVESYIESADLEEYDD